MDPAIREPGFTVPDRGERRKLVGFSTWLELVLAAGLITLFLVGMLSPIYHELVLSLQLRSAVLFVFWAVVLTNVVTDQPKTVGKRIARLAAFAAASGGGAYAAIWLVPQSLTLVGRPHVAVRIVFYLGLCAVGFWAWGVWLWLYASVWLRRGVGEGPDGVPGRDARPLGKSVRRAWALLAGACCASWRRTIVHVAMASRAACEEGVFGNIALGLLDPLFLYPTDARTDALVRAMGVAGHRIIDERRPASGLERDARQLASLKNLVVLLALLFLLGSMVQVRGCLRETPKGVLFGKGTRIAKGRVPVQRKRRERQKREKRKTQDQIVRESLIKLFREEMKDLMESAAVTEASVTGDVGLPDGQGRGETAAGSPKGTQVGGRYYMFRIKYEGGNWDANRKGIPALMREFTKAVNVQTNPYDQAVTLSELPKHKGVYFPVLLYITGNGSVSASDKEVENLRRYLLDGGFLFADSSGGNFYDHFMALMQRVFPDKRFRVIAYDHTVFRGEYMPWLMREGCPVYRRHRGAADAMGLFIGQRLAVLYSGGDLGAAWAAVGWGKKRRDVELAFRMGTNIISYAMLYGGLKGLEDEE